MLSSVQFSRALGWWVSRPAASVYVGRPRLTAAERRVLIRSVWVSLSSVPARCRVDSHAILLGWFADS